MGVANLLFDILLHVNSSVGSNPSLCELVAEHDILTRHHKLDKLDLLISDLTLFS